MKKIFLLAIDFYRAGISPFRSNSCRFVPTCSHYAKEAVRSHGAFRGAWLSFSRVFRCHPFHPGGFDPVP